MRIHIILLFLTATILGGCKKQNNDDLLIAHSGTKKFNVNFSPEVFDVIKSQSIAHTLTDPSLSLYTRIYDLDNGGSLIKKSNNTSIGFDLPPGNYVAVFLASNHQFYKFSTGGAMDLENPFGSAFFDTRFSVGIPNNPLSDIFYKKIYFTVNNNDINQKVVLEKIVTDLEVVIEDEVPPSVSALQVTVVNDAVTFNFHNDSREGKVDKISTFSTNSNHLSSYVLGFGTKTIVIRAYDKDGNIFQEKRVSATFSSDKKIILSGKLFAEYGVFTASITPV